MKEMKDETIDLIFADPPYFLSNGGVSIKSGKIVSVDKGDWDKKSSYKSTEEFTKSWLNESYRLLKEDGSIWVSGTHHNIFEVHKVMKEIGFKVINVVIWHKSNPPPLIYKNKFRFSHEIIIWAKKDMDHHFNYESMYKIENKEMEDVWTIPAVQINEKEFGYHPTQKPINLLNRIITASSQKGDLILDPFMGSGTTCISAILNERNYIGIELEEKYYNIAKSRINYHLKIQNSSKNKPDKY
jgi:site-specific DNA-methyltransferase (adenine-specific)